ncbi:hypothetical protein [Actinacidiphila rubida]|uniref:Integral membrane protein n=1 Tax=Actinacidiphila rubida TaxID=310780 RepID=A0A1H8PDP3_9ACTN|nr:hypothetical protein [Actinacidiphila rubida]SEO40055.1 hypothetical protein SAMN05216267_102573 [Actinacidiphila rubida]
MAEDDAGDGSANETGDQAGKPIEENDVTADPSTAGGPEQRQPAAPVRIGTGPGRLLLWLYGIFTVAALSRSIVQISMKFHHAPLAYSLSAVAGVVYAVILVALSKGGESARRVAMVCCSIELVGVVTVGTLTVVDSSAFADSTVWSYYGAGYLLLPLALPVTGLLWLRRAAREAVPAAAGAPVPDAGRQD